MLTETGMGFFQHSLQVEAFPIKLLTGLSDQNPTLLKTT